MEIRLFCPECKGYLSKHAACSCGWARPQSVNNPLEPVWRVQLPASVVGTLLFTPPGDCALVGYGSCSGAVGGLASVALEDGGFRWRIDVGASVEGGAALARRRLVLFGDTQGRLHSLRFRDGQPAWPPVRLDGAVTAAPLIAQQVRAFIGTARGNVYCLDWRNGRQLWRTTLPQQPRRPRPRVAGRPVWAEGQVWVGAYDGHLYALDGDRGSLAAVYDARSEIRTALQAVGRHLVFATNRGTLHVVNARTGEAAWPPFEASRGIPAAPLVRESVIYATSLDHFLYAVDLSTGELRWSLDLDHGLATTPAWIDGGWLALGTNRGDVVAVDVACREVVWRYSVNDGRPDMYGRPYAVLGGPVAREGIVYVGAGDGRLYALPWHLGKWERAAEALARVDRHEEAAACLALSGALDADLRVARFLEAHGHADLAARVYEALGMITDAARAYESAARQNLGGEVADLWERAHSLWLRLDESQRAHEARRQAAEARGDPLLDVQWIGDTAFRQGETSHIYLRVSNGTSSVARGIRVIARGPGFSPTERWRAELVHGDTWDCRLEQLVPECAGAATLHVEVRCEGRKGRQVAYRWQYAIQVAPRGQPPTIVNVARQFTGPAHVVAVEGDAGMVRVDDAPGRVSGSVSVGGDVGMVRTSGCPEKPEEEQDQDRVIDRE